MRPRRRSPGKAPRHERGDAAFFGVSRIDPGLALRLALSKPGEVVSRASAARVALLAGLEALEAKG